MSDVKRTVSVLDVSDGDLVDLEPLLVAWGARDERYESDLMYVQCELCVVETVTRNTDGSVTIYTDAMNLAVPEDAEVTIWERKDAW